MSRYVSPQRARSTILASLLLAAFADRVVSGSPVVAWAVGPKPTRSSVAQTGAVPPNCLSLDRCR
jgi:hypothetical protein